MWGDLTGHMTTSIRAHRQNPSTCATYGWVGWTTRQYKDSSSVVTFKAVLQLGRMVPIGKCGSRGFYRSNFQFQDDHSELGDGRCRLLRQSIQNHFYWFCIAPEACALVFLRREQVEVPWVRYEPSRKGFELAEVGLPEASNLSNSSVWFSFVFIIPDL